MMYAKSNDASAAGISSTEPTPNDALASDIARCQPHLARRHVDAVDSEAQRAHASHIRPLPAADVEPAASDALRLDDLSIRPVLRTSSACRLDSGIWTS